MDSALLDNSPLQQYVEALHANLWGCEDRGVAGYVPELLRVSHDAFDIAV